MRQGELSYHPRMANVPYRVGWSVVRSASIGQGLVGAFKSLAGGNIQEYVDVCEAARHDATEVLAYGTAVRVVQS